TEPVGYHAQPWFLNQVMKVGVRKESPYYDNPTAFLHDLLELESQLGRQRTMPFGPRTVDIDLLLQDGLIENFPTDDSLSVHTAASREAVNLEASSLILPHPRFHLRGFVLEPLCEVEPGLVHPVFGVSCLELLSRLPQSGPIVRRRPANDGETV
ncbi:MAG: 2-amino-4-hydroxy-6-hydroxymethyldihydropteridine diphosphokinase, partial [Blastocatellia bacterium]